MLNQYKVIFIAVIQYDKKRRSVLHVSRLRLKCKGLIQYLWRELSQPYVYNFKCITDRIKINYYFKVFVSIEHQKTVSYKWDFAAASKIVIRKPESKIIVNLKLSNWFITLKYE